MYLKINPDHARFKQIVRGKIKKDLRKYISQGQMIGVKGKKLISIPSPSIDLPHFEFGKNQSQGVGAGEGDAGQSIGPGENSPGKAGDSEGQHLQEVDISLEEMAQILGEELGLPNIKPRGNRSIESERDRVAGMQTVGPKSMLHFKKTFKQALKRHIASDNYNSESPDVRIEPRDYQFRSWKTKPIECNNAVIILIMDVSGSMGDEQKEIVRTESFWIDTWLQSQYKGIETRYIIHDATAKEVQRETFFSTRESGGTIISSAYSLANEIIQRDYPVEEWNVYPFHFSDGDNWSADDTLKCFQLLEDKILPRANMFCYGQVESLYGSGQFYRDLMDHFGTSHPFSKQVVASKIPNKDAIYDSIKDFLKKGL